MPSTLEPQTFLARDMDRAQIFRAPGGVAAVYTRRRPKATRKNQDAAAVCFANGLWTLAAIDGVGGGRGGGKASGALATEVARIFGKRKPRRIRPAMLDAIEAANEQVLGMRLGAGATFATATVIDGALRTYHGGDCGAMVVGQRGKLKLHTVAHSPIGYAFGSGLLDEAEAMSAPYRHLILNMLGSNELRIEVGVPRPLAANDTLLLASDGLFDNLFVYEIVELIRKGPLEWAATSLAEACRRRMAGEEADGEVPQHPDDLTFILFRRV